MHEARVRKELTLEEAARATKIRADRLRDLEEERYENFPNLTYARGFLLIYARFLGVDISRYQTIDIGNPARGGAYQYLSNSVGMQTVRTFTPQQRPLNRSRFLMISAVFGGAILLGGLTAYVILNVLRLPSLEQLVETDKAPVAEIVAAASPTPEPAPTPTPESTPELTPPGELAERMALEGEGPWPLQEPVVDPWINPSLTPSPQVEPTPEEIDAAILEDGELAAAPFPEGPSEQSESPSVEIPLDEEGNPIAPRALPVQTPLAVEATPTPTATPSPTATPASRRRATQPRSTPRSRARSNPTPRRSQ